MAIVSVDTSITPPHSLLISLRAVLKAQQTRVEISNELDAALSSFLTQSPSPLELPSEANGAAEPTACQMEAVRPPNEVEMQEVLKIGFTGLLEIRGEMQELAAVLRMIWSREDLAKVLDKAEELEGEKLKVVSASRD